MLAKIEPRETIFRRSIVGFIGVKMLKLSILLIPIFFLVSCYEMPQDIEVSTKPLPTPTLTDSEKAKKTQQIEKVKADVKEFIAEESPFYGLSKLGEKNLSDKDLEIRLWRFSAFGDRHLVFVLTRTNEVWSAKIVQRTIDQKIIVSNISNKVKFAKFSQRKLGTPKSGWDSLWQKLIDDKILTLPDGGEVGNEPFPDGWAFVVETKVEDQYRSYNYIGPEEFPDIREAQQMVKIIRIISEEFDLDDFDSNNFMLP